MRRFLLVCISSFLLVATVYAQERTVTGKVTSAEDGSALPGVNVVVKGTTNGTVTDAAGNYKLSVPADGGTLVFSFIGLTTSEVSVGSRQTIDVQMAADVTQLSEIVVIGYGEQSTRNNLQAIATVNSDVFKNVPAISPQQLLQGQAAGVQMVNSSGVDRIQKFPQTVKVIKYLENLSLHYRKQNLGQFLKGKLIITLDSQVSRILF